MAVLFLLDTYENSAKHKRLRPDLPREIKINVDGTRSQIYRIGFHFPAPYNNRNFETWLTWKKLKLDTGQVAYMIGIAPLKDYQGTGFDELPGFINAQSTGCYVITEIAPEVCTWTCIQNVDLNVYNPVIESHINQTHMKWPNILKERYRRNSRKVDNEIRKVLVERMKEGAALDRVSYFAKQ